MGGGDIVVEVRDEAKKDWKKGMKYKDIADKYGVSLSTVKSWAARYWKNEKVATKATKKVATKKEKVATKKKMGPPYGNKNAVGTVKYSAPHNQNNFKHGAYSEVYWDTLTEDEKNLIDDIPDDEELQLIEQLKLFTVRERRIMLAIKTVKEQSGNVIITSVIRGENKREFVDEQEKELYEQRRRANVLKAKATAGHGYSVTTNTENKEIKIERLEAELTKVQKAKTKCIDSLAKIRIEKERMNGDSKGNDAVRAWVDALKRKRGEL